MALTSFCSIIAAAAAAAGNEHDHLAGCTTAACVVSTGFISRFFGGGGGGGSLPAGFFSLVGTHLMKSVLQTHVSFDTSIDSFGSYIINSKQSGRTDVSVGVLLSGSGGGVSRSFDWSSSGPINSSSFCLSGPIPSSVAFSSSSSSSSQFQ